MCACEAPPDWQVRGRAEPAVVCEMAPGERDPVTVRLLPPALARLRCAARAALAGDVPPDFYHGRCAIWYGSAFIAGLRDVALKTNPASYWMVTDG